jgi:hypothetical protein
MVYRINIRIWNALYAEYKAVVAKAMAGQPEDLHKKIELKVLEEFGKLMPKRCRTLATGSYHVNSNNWN